MGRSVLGLCLALAACSSPPGVPSVEGWGGYSSGYHRGPKVLLGDTGTARFVGPLLGGFDEEAAMATVAELDPWFREPGNDGFEFGMDVLLAKLRGAGFGSREGYELREIETPMDAPAWTPLSASLTLHLNGEPIQVLHQFNRDDDRERTMLPVHASSCDVRGTPELDFADLDPGEIFVTDRDLDEVLHQAQERGAAAVLSSFLFDFNVDPRGTMRHLDAIHYGAVPVGTTLPVAHISPRIHALLADLEDVACSELHLQANVRFDERPLRTLVATVVGLERPAEVVPLVAHMQEPGTNDNASGVAGMLEGALTLMRAVDDRKLRRPMRSISFVWGDEYTASGVFLDHTERTVVAALAADMIGNSPAETGAVCLLERGPDPGARWVLPPDEHTAWGAGEVDLDWILPSGLAVILRMALVDVGLAVGGWVSGEHPWEGGSDHDVFLGRGIPAALLWHFPDFAYHTNLDRLAFVDPRELRLSSVALLCAACGVADARPKDLERYIESLLHERYERQGIAWEEEAPEEVATSWGEWSSAARRWLAFLCNGTPAR
jgi:hypothetical protein